MQVHEMLVLENFPSPLERRVALQPLRVGQASLSLVATVVHGSLVGLDATRRLTIPAGALQAGQVASNLAGAAAAAPGSVPHGGALHPPGGDRAAENAAMPGSPAGCSGGGSPGRAEDLAAIVSAAEAGQGDGDPANPMLIDAGCAQLPVSHTAAGTADSDAPRGQPPALGSAAWHAAGSVVSAAERAQVGALLRSSFCQACLHVCILY